jgi:hypothetical protein
MTYLVTQSDHPDQPLEPNEAQLGLKHRDIIHMLEILRNPATPRPNKLKAFRLLKEVLPDHEQHAFQHQAVPVITPYLYDSHKGLVLLAVSCLVSFVLTEDLAKSLSTEVSRLLEFIDPEEESPLRLESATLLRIIVEFTGPIREFVSEPGPSRLLRAISSRQTDVPFIHEMFGLLSRLANTAAVRTPLCGSIEFLMLLIRSFANVQLRQRSIILASTIAMDPTHSAKLALLNCDIIPSIAPFLEAPHAELRYSILSLLCLLAVPKEGKHKISTDRDLPDAINSIARNDEDDQCREAALELKVLVTELPLGKAILGTEKSTEIFE